MSVYHDELKKRLLRDGLRAAAMWFVRIVADKKLDGEDFSPLEHRIWREIERGLTPLKNSSAANRWIEAPNLLRLSPFSKPRNRQTNN